MDIPWFAWIAIVAIIAVFTYASIGIVSKNRAAGRDLEDGQRKLAADVEALQRRVESLEAGRPRP
ncbi:hypothetical protein ARHIZOSPH14_29330 [Agromyces rhizosphaerae]|uniref:Uncharacterized protein n=1 Tax=Agromyces rhizosphaerae TaxID=88374 RepID=A0A9W6CTF4_9MICO|nr:hypothetical protein [Agromyces rhizosphaerae]GLI28691.1 hypothetical protein ARHIZOSPH14_29330 [Agromyces rhizosphaerae]